MTTKAETTAAGPSKKSRLNAAVPGVGMLRTYKPAWLRFDLVAGIVLAAILVPQGLAYAELAGLPPVTGLYTTIACLVVYALLGPSSDPGARPGLRGLAADLRGHRAADGDRRPRHGHRARRDARDHGGPHRDRPRSRQAGVHRRPAQQGGPGRLHERAGHHHLRRPASQALRLLDRRGHLHPGGQGVLLEPRPDQRHHAAGRSGHPGAPARAAPALEEDPGRAGRGRRRHRRLGRAGPGRRRREDGGHAAAGAPRPFVPVDERERPHHAGRGRGRHRARLPDRHHRHLVQLRREARRRGGREPRDDRRGRLQRGGRPLPGLRDLGERLPDGRRRELRAPRPR